MTPQTLIFFGMQGSGKGTQVAHLKNHFHKEDETAEIFQYETGNGFREMAKSESYTSKLVKETIDAGESVPVFLPIALWANAFKNEFKGTEHIFIDGFPRRIVEAEVLHTALTFYKRLPAKVIVLELNEEEALKRLMARGRHDDTEEGIKKRLGWYDEEVSPILDWYEKHEGYEVVKINGVQTEEEVHTDIVKAVF